MAHEEAGLSPDMTPDTTVSVREVFGIDQALEVPAFSRRTDYVPAVDAASLATAIRTMLFWGLPGVATYEPRPPLAPPGPPAPPPTMPPPTAPFEQIRLGEWTPHPGIFASLAAALLLCSAILGAAARPCLAASLAERGCWRRDVTVK